MLIFAALRLGRYVAKVPHAVVSGFSCGVGAMMVILQLRTLLGLTSSPLARSVSPLGQLGQVLLNLPQLRWEPLLMGSIVVVGAMLIARRWPRSPAALMGVGMAVAAGFLFGWRERVLGEIALKMPSIASFVWKSGDLTDIVPNAFGLAFVSSVNILITSRVVEHFRGRHHHSHASDADKELFAYGVANLFSSGIGAPMSVGIPARSLANVRCGGTTRLSNLLHAVFLLILVGIGSAMISQIPLAALAGVTAYVGLSLLEWSTWPPAPPRL